MWLLRALSVLLLFAGDFFGIEVAIAKAQDEKASEVSLFNGKDLSGWNGDRKWFRVENGAIVAGSLKERSIPHNYFLATEEQYHDFELNLKVKLRPSVAGQWINGGIQFRSVRVTDSTEMIGYQADIGTGVWGSLYDESRRREFLTPKSSSEALAKVVKQDGWNDYRLVSKGRRIQIWVNGKQITDYREKDDKVSRATGYIALQIHSSKHPAEILYKDIFLKER